MKEPPVYSRFEADRILRRAAELEGSDEGKQLTARELRLIAREAGFGADAVDRALSEARESAPQARRPPVQRWGIFVTRISAIRRIPKEIDSDQLMKVVRLFHPYREGPPRVKLESREVTWRDRKGLRFAVHSTGGATEIRVFVSKVLLRRGRWTGWVKAAADRLDTLVEMVAEGSDPTGPPPSDP